MCKTVVAAIERFSLLLFGPLLALSIACQTNDASARLAATHAETSFSVGFGRRDLSTRRKLTMGGYGTYVGLPSATRQSGEGVHDPLYADAMAVITVQGNGVVLVSIDAVGLAAPTIARIRERTATELGDAAASLTFLVAATHTHHSPDTMGLWGALPFFTGRDARYMQRLEERAAEAIIEAVVSAEPAALLLAGGSKPNSSSEEPDPALVDDAFLTLIALRSDGSMLGTLTQWAAHPTELGANNNALSADFVGAYRRYMETTYPGSHMYLNGALGDLYATGPKQPISDPFPEGDRDPDVGEGYGKMAAVGYDLFARVSAAITSATPLTGSDIEVREQLIQIPIRNWIFELAVSLRLIETRIENGAAASPIAWFRIGQLQGVTVPGELFAGGAQTLRAMLVDNGSSAQLLVGMGQDWLGYIMSEAEYDDDEYQYQRLLSPSREAQAVLLMGYQELLAP